MTLAPGRCRARQAHELDGWEGYATPPSPRASPHGGARGIRTIFPSILTSAESSEQIHPSWTTRIYENLTRREPRHDTPGLPADPHVRRKAGITGSLASL
jgi:hypothetical protein